MHRTTSSAHSRTGKPLTSQAFEALARHALRAAPQDPSLAAAGHRPSDFDLNPGHEASLNPPLSYRQAAVLVPIVAHNEPTVLLTQRTSTLTKHAGQIAFPGGTADAADADPLMTALRETSEEIGLRPHLVRPLGYLDCYRTGTGYVITPVVGVIEPGFEVTLNANEVDGVFEVPLNFLMDAANHIIDTRMLLGRERQFYAMPYEGRYIWGATAGIIRNMHERFFSS
jgi:8-oxo-dGTP pyrophosphatase MutT (NUDIX family)